MPYGDYSPQIVQLLVFSYVFIMLSVNYAGFLRDKNFFITGPLANAVMNW